MTTEFQYFELIQVIVTHRRYTQKDNLYFGKDFCLAVLYNFNNNIVVELSNYSFYFANIVEMLLYECDALYCMLWFLVFIVTLTLSLTMIFLWIPLSACMVICIHVQSTPDNKKLDKSNFCLKKKSPPLSQPALLCISRKKYVRYDHKSDKRNIHITDTEIAISISISITLSPLSLSLKLLFVWLSDWFPLLPYLRNQWIYSIV